MTFKDILVYADGGASTAARLDVAATLAAQHASRLTAIHVAVPPYVPFDLAGSIPGDLVQWQEDYQRDQSAAAAKAVEAARRRNSCAIELLTLRGELGATVLGQSPCADLVVVGQRGTDDGESLALDTLPEALILGSGRPVLVVPRDSKAASIGKRVIVAWRATRESARAVHDALPLLTRADWVTVLEVNPPPDSAVAQVGSGDVVDHLRRHGVRVDSAPVSATGIDAGAVVLRRADEHQADLVVAGGYGHSRLREFALGGVTRHLLSNAKMAVLLSH